MKDGKYNLIFNTYDEKGRIIRKQQVGDFTIMHDKVVETNGSVNLPLGVITAATNYRITHSMNNGYYSVVKSSPLKKNINNAGATGVSALAKGVARKKWPFDPTVDIDRKNREHVEDWVSGYSGRDRAGMAPLVGNALKRGLHRLYGKTQSRKNANTEEREVLLHRGVSIDEHNHVMKTGHLNNLSSWTPDLDTAVSFGHNYANPDLKDSAKKNAKVLSAWVPISMIHHIPNAIGSASSDVEGILPESITSKDMKPNHRDIEHEIIVKPHKLNLAEPKKDYLEKGQNGDWEKGGYSIQHSFDELNPNKLTISSTASDGDYAGYARFEIKNGILVPDSSPESPGEYPIEAVEVEPKHQRKGVATSMYKYAENLTGLPVHPDDNQTDSAKALWNQKNRPFGNLKKSADTSKIASCAIIDGNYILMARRRDNGLWTIPGGHLESGESPKDGAARELFEESGIKTKLKPLTSEKISGNDGITRVIYAFLGHGDHATNTHHDPDGEVFRWYWVDVSNGLPEDIKNNLHSPKNVTLKALGLLDY